MLARSSKGRPSHLGPYGERGRPPSAGCTHPPESSVGKTRDRAVAGAGPRGDIKESQRYFEQFPAGSPLPRSCWQVEAGGLHSSVSQLSGDISPKGLTQGGRGDTRERLGIVEAT